MLSMAAGGWLPFALGDDLPPPPSAISMPDTTLYLEPVVNGRQTGNVVPVNYRGGHYYMTPQQLLDAGLPVADKQAKDIAVDRLEKVDVSYSGESQQLLINVPNDWLPQQTIGARSPLQRLPAQSSLGLLFNYDIYASQSNGNGRATCRRGANSGCSTGSASSPTPASTAAGLTAGQTTMAAAIFGMTATGVSTMTSGC